MAAKPEEKNDNKPVAWVTWAGSNGKAKDVMPQGHMVGKFHVKKLSDGSVVGDAHIKYLDGEFTYEYELYDAYFATENGTNVAYLLVTVEGPWPGFGTANITMCWRFVDGGEPAKGNGEFRNYFYAVPNIDPLTALWPPETGLDFFTPPWIPFFPPTGLGANVQIKITDAYYDL